MSKRKYNHHKENCSSKVRAIITDKYGNTITLCGKHAFEWSIVKETNDKIIVITFKSRIEAVKELQRLKG